MKVTDLLSNSPRTGFSFEILPPLKGNSIEQSFKTVELLRDFDPLYVNITTHRSELVYKDTPNGLYRKVSERVRPGTVAVAAAIQHRYGITVVPHMICSGFTALETEYALIDLRFLGIHNLLVLRGDKAKHENKYTPAEGGHAHAIDLARQINNFNKGIFSDGTLMESEPIAQFSYGVAGYPEKHEEAPNLDEDILRLKEKVDAGADYIVTQMFFDNEKYFNFVQKCRNAGINVPIIPGLKPICYTSQLTVIPKVFHVDFPTELARELAKCQTNEQTVEVGVEWCTMQARELISRGVPSIHFYSLGASKSVSRIAKAVY